MIRLIIMLIFLTNLTGLSQVSDSDLLLKYDDITKGHRDMTTIKEVSLKTRVKYSWQRNSDFGDVSLTPAHMNTFSLGFFHEYAEMTDNCFGAGVDISYLDSGKLQILILEGYMTQRGIEPYVVDSRVVSPNKLDGINMRVSSERTGANYHLVFESREQPLPSTGWEIDNEILRHKVLLDHMKPIRELTENYRCSITTSNRAVRILPDYVRAHGVVIGVPRIGKDLSIGHNSVFDGRSILMPWIPLEFHLKLIDNRLHFLAVEVPKHITKVSPASEGKLSRESIDFYGQNELRISIDSKVSSKEFLLTCSRK